MLKNLPTGSTGTTEPLAGNLHRILRPLQSGLENFAYNTHFTLVLSVMSKNVPTEIYLNRRTRILTVSFEQEVFELSCEYLRAHSPSAEVQGHGPGQDVLQTGKENVNIDSIESVGNYGIKPVFDDGHDTGIFSWDTLYKLAINHNENWERYMQRLEEAGITRKLDS